MRELDIEESQGVSAVYQYREIGGGRGENRLPKAAIHCLDLRHQSTAREPTSVLSLLLILNSQGMSMLLLDVCEFQEIAISVAPTR